MRPMTYERWQRKQYRRSFSPVGWTLLIYYVLMNVVVVVASLITGTTDGEGWGYILSVALGLVILLLWKKPRFWKNEIWARGMPMRFGAFWKILCIFTSGQAFYQMLTSSAELLLNSCGFTLLEGLEAMAVDLNSFSMFLYAGILAPITEEVLFRGLIQRSLQPYGKKFAVLCSAFVFGIFHGNPLQSPYAFLVGLVLGYTAAEYSIGWAMVLHMINNLVIADMLTRLTAGMDEMAAGLVITLLVWAFAIAAVVVFVRNHGRIREYLSQEKINGEYLKCFFSSAGMIVLMILMAISMIAACFMMITPL